ncbi:hypothetical protein BT10792_30045 [Bacillus thuringiensis]|nr:hypothetical protein BT10792_30045 [Bacillus thuringiensis]
MLLYSLLHLSGYDVTMDDLKNFRQWGSKTPGHPEYGHNSWCRCNDWSTWTRYCNCCRYGNG